MHRGTRPTWKVACIVPVDRLASRKTWHKFLVAITRVIVQEIFSTLLLLVKPWCHFNFSGLMFIHIYLGFSTLYMSHSGLFAVIFVCVPRLWCLVVTQALLIWDEPLICEVHMALVLELGSCHHFFC